MDTPVYIARTLFCDLLDTLLKLGLLVAMCSRAVSRAMCLKHATGPPDADTPDGPQLVHQFPTTSRPRTFV